MKSNVGSISGCLRNMFCSVKAVAVAGVFSAFAISATADQITTEPGFGPFAIGSGGEFTARADGTVLGWLGSGYISGVTRDLVERGTFQTFCVERNEYITPATTFDVTLGSVTIFSGKPLTVGAAYLYQQFATGALTYNYADSPPGTRAGYASSLYNAFNLQTAIWYFMGEYGYDQYNPYMNGLSVPLPANPFAADNGAHGVSVLSLWAPGQPHDPAHAYQDLLIITVPEPSSLALLSLAAVALFARKRK